MSDLEELYSIVAGEKVSVPASEAWENINPATGKPTATVFGADDTVIDRAVAAAKTAQAAWAETPPFERAAVLLRAADLLEERRADFARAETLDTGKPYQEIVSDDVVTAYDCLRYFGGVLPSLAGRHVDFGRSFAYSRREPIGICAGIGPWNYPIQLAAWKLAPALAAGNALIFKPSEQTPRTALMLAELMVDAGLPHGLFSVVLGTAAVGQRLSTDPEIGKISFTGSDAVGRKVNAAAAPTLKRVTMELGGKGPMLVLSDADVDRAVRGAMLANFVAGGENCCNGPRVFVHSSIYDTFLEQVAGRTDALRVGDPFDASTQIGAQISKEHLEKVLGYVEAGIADGARLIAGGSRADVDGHPDGYFMRPTVFADVEDDMSIAREEIFGPVMTVLRFDDTDEAVERANANPYGLSAGVFTQDMAAAHETIRKLNAGTTWINTFNFAPVNLPFGGVKQSGFGRENGLDAFEAYTQTKSVYVEVEPLETPFD